MARLFAFFTLFHFSLTFFRPEVPFNDQITKAMFHQIDKIEKGQFLSSIEHGGTRTFFIFMATLPSRIHIYGSIGPF